MKLKSAFSRSSFSLFDLLYDGGQHLVQVTDDAKIGKGEDPRLRILVHRDDGFGRLHSRPVLDGAGDACGDVQLWRNCLARLTNLDA